MVNSRDLKLPVSGASMPLAVFRLEAISCAIRQSFNGLATGQHNIGSKTGGDAYTHFRSRAYRLLTHYVDHDLQDAFRWLLLMKGAAPRKTRISLDQNPFHWGLLAITAAAGTFMSPNKLRSLGSLMKRAHAQGIKEEGFEAYIRRTRKDDRMTEFQSVMSALSGRRPKRP